MGLDNGIIVKGIPKEDIPTWLTIDFDKCISEYEFAYWRKCYGIRDEIVRVLHMDPLEFDIQLDIEDLDAVIRTLTPFLQYDYWDDNADSIWQYDVYIGHQIDILINLRWLLNYWRTTDKTLTVVFYNSY